MFIATGHPIWRSNDVTSIGTTGTDTAKHSNIDAQHQLQRDHSSLLFRNKSYQLHITMHTWFKEIFKDTRFSHACRKQNYQTKRLNLRLKNPCPSSTYIHILENIQYTDQGINSPFIYTHKFGDKGLEMKDNFLLSC